MTGLGRTFCGGSVIFSGTNQVIDCNGQSISGVVSADVFIFNGNGPYILKNCQIFAAPAAWGIMVNGDTADKLKSIDILIEGISVLGMGLGAGALLQPSGDLTLCATIQRSLFTELISGIDVVATLSSKVFLDLMDLNISSNRMIGTRLQSSNGNSITATISNQLSTGNDIGLSVIGSDTRVDVTDSIFCSSTLDVSLANGATGFFSNSICSLTEPDSQKPDICAADCQSF
jgi:hypothetical protein